MRVLLFFFLIVVTNMQSQTKGTTLRESSFNISVENKRGKEFYYRSNDRAIFNAECMILIKEKDQERSTPNKIIGVSTGFKEKGIFKQGYKNGNWKTTYKSKVVKTENWDNGLIIGMYKVFNTKKKLLYETVFGKNGTSKYKDYYYKTGILKVEGNYTYGKKEDIWNYYNKKGDKINTINYTQGVPNN